MHGTDWPREKIVEEIYARGHSVTSLARHLGEADTVVFRVLRPQFRWPRIQARVAAFLGVEPHEIWPSRYRSPGIPVGRPHPAQSLTASLRPRPRSKRAGA